MYRNPRMYDRVLGIIHGESYDQRFRRIAELIGSGRNVLDVGCGTCHLAGFLHDCRYTGLDLNQTFVAYARTRGVDARVADVFDPTFYAHDIDVIVSCDMLHHVVPRDSEYVSMLGATGAPLVILSETVMEGASAFQKLLGIIMDNDGINDLRARWRLHMKHEYTVAEYRRIFESSIPHRDARYEEFDSPGHFFRRRGKLQLKTIIATFHT